MRVALVVGSAYGKNAKLAAIPSAELDIDLVARRLAEPDAGFRVLRFEAERGLAERIEQRLLAQLEPIEALLVYFSGYSVLSDDRGPALLLDGERLGTFSVKRLKNLFLHFAPSSCLVVDVAAIVEPNQRLSAVTAAIGGTVTEDGSGVQALVSVRSSEAPDSLQGSAFTRRLLSALQSLSVSRKRGERIDLQQVFGEMSGDVPAAGVFGGPGDSFTIFPGERLSVAESGLPSSEERLPRFEDSTPPEATLPKLEIQARVPAEPIFPQVEEPTPGRDAALAPFEDSAPSDGALPRFDDTTSPQIGLPRFEDPSSPQSLLPRFDDTTSPQIGLPRFEHPSSPPKERARAEAPSTVQTALPRLEESSADSSLPRFDDTTSPQMALPRFEDTVASSDALPRYEANEGPVALPSGQAASTTQSVPIRRLDPPSSSSSSKPLPRFEIPTGAASDLDALLGLGGPTEARPPASSLPAAPPDLEDNEPVTQPGGSPFDSERVLAAARASSAELFAEPSASAAVAEERVSPAALEEEVSQYEAALHVSASPYERAALLAAIARVLVKLGRPEQAAERFSEASDLDSAHPDVLCVRAEWAEAARDFENLLQTVETWLAACPGDPRPLGFFARAAEALGDPLKAFEAWSNLGISVDSSKKARVDALSNASRIAETKLDDVRAAENFAGEAFALSPEQAPLRQRASELFSKSSHPQGLFAYFEQALDVLEDRATLAALVDEIEAYARKLGDMAPAVQAFERAASIFPGDLWLRDRLTEFYARAENPHDALVHCRVAAQLSPTRARTYRRAQALFHAGGMTDGAWNAASVLEALGEADINEALFASQHKPEGLLAARNMLADAEWPSGLLSDVRDPELEAVLSALDPAAVRVGIALLKQKKRYIELDPALKEDPDRSTTMLAKTLGWTSRLLGMPPPSLYILPELEPALDVAPSEEPGALVSRALGTGLGLGELAFLWGRHLTRFRSELRALSFFRDPEELSSMLRAALALGGAADLDVRDLEGETKRLYAALRREVQGTALDRLHRAAHYFPIEELDQRAQSALRGLELAGVRAGLLCCGDVAAAAELIRRFPESGLTETEDQLGELYAFSISEAYEALRVRIGVAVAA